MTLTEFLLARIAEDEAAAHAASGGAWSYPGIESVSGGLLYDGTRQIAQISWDNTGDHDGSIVRFLPSSEADANGMHIARNHPARVLAECAAKRAIVEDYWERDENYRATRTEGTELRRCQALISCARLATVYADHPDFNEDWRP